jgi:addiction module RelE/StbE family toxin
MVEITFTKSFKKAFKKLIKRNSNLEDIFWGKISLFIENPNEKTLKTHKLSGKLEELWGFSLNFEIRIIFFYSENNKVVLTDIGSHDEVY